MIDWSNEKCKVTPNFTVGECLKLHQWNRLATDKDGLTDTIKSELVKLCALMETIRAVLNAPIKVHCMYRSPAYNKLIGAHEHEVHSLGMAIDFDCLPTLSIEEVKEQLRPILNQYHIRIERGTSTWVHLDTKAPGASGREFTA